MNENRTEASGREKHLFKKIYIVLIVLLYQLVGGYFVYFSHSEGVEEASLPPWAYTLFGAILMIYGVSRLFRFNSSAKQKEVL